MFFFCDGTVLWYLFLYFATLCTCHINVCAIYCKNVCHFSSHLRPVCECECVCMCSKEFSVSFQIVAVQQENAKKTCKNCTSNGYKLNYKRTTVQYINTKFKHSYIYIFFVHSLTILSEQINQTYQQKLQKKRGEKIGKNGLFNSFHFVAFVCISLKTYGGCCLLLLYFFLNCICVYIFFSFFPCILRSSVLVGFVGFFRVFCCIVFDCRHCQYMYVNRNAHTVSSLELSCWLVWLIQCRRCSKNRSWLHRFWCSATFRTLPC